MSKSFSDSVYGSISLTPLEADIVSTPCFQRLHNVKQLGLAHLVFPGANYSRFSHSIGACHNAGRLIDAIEKNTNTLIDHKKREACRLAALLHDVGHYPFSHATEHKIENFYADKKMLVKDGASGGDSLGKSESVSYTHERVGEKIIELDSGIRDVFKRHNFDDNRITEIFSKEDTENNLLHIVSSDLDCDRLDYLSRTAHTTGLPYGMVDINYIISQATRTKDGMFGFSAKALRAADHLLISRYYDYIQVPYHKTVQALEWSLTECIGALLKRNILDCSSTEIKRKITDNEWAAFDDNVFTEMFRRLLNEGDELEVLHARAVLFREIPKLVFCYEQVGPKSDLEEVEELKKQVEQKVNDVANKFGIDKRKFYVSYIPLDVTKAGAKCKAHPEGDAWMNDPDTSGCVVIIDEKWSPGAVPLVNRKDSLLHTLAQHRFVGLRVYLLDCTKQVRESVAEEFRKISREKQAPEHGADSVSDNVTDFVCR